jgi:hypothetical protein
MKCQLYWLCYSSQRQYLKWAGSFWAENNMTAWIKEEAGIAQSA